MELVLFVVGCCRWRREFLSEDDDLSERLLSFEVFDFFLLLLCEIKKLSKAISTQEILYIQFSGNF